MKKYIRYLYEYQNGRRVQNAGFVKVNEGEDSAVIQIYGKGFPASGSQTLEILLFYLAGQQAVGISMGTVRGNQPMFGYRLEYTADDVEGMQIFREIEGIILLSDNHGFRRWYGAVWNEQPVRIEQMIRREEILRRGKNEAELPGERAEEMRGTEPPREMPGEAREIAPPRERQENGQTEETRETELPREMPGEMRETAPPREMSGETWETEPRGRRENRQTEVMRETEPLRETPGETREIAPQRETRETAPRERQENRQTEVVRETEPPREMSGETRETASPREMPGKTREIAPPREQQEMRETEPLRETPEATREPESPRETPEPMREQEQPSPRDIIYKITRQDMVQLPRRDWKLANNRFLLHGYHNYHHLVSFEKDGNCWLGVPGIYHPGEQRAATAFGFEQFMRPEEGEIELTAEECSNQEEFGYWCRAVGAVIAKEKEETEETE